ncbi:LuxR C-terminal-related transcriptional regulator [Clostridium sp. SHJSY1]|uniref:LuxR C-terminal-related transcriptional regulator n=1 Tax=Clostridium sp. SHJSY1 TaxID=2942483 RepID=UPI002876A10D|nr:LuxR C-terminal-related transcriptional regulator [Clostridium sp. SHJSY1]MDS0525872.1 LuxR C-terminal-related transcriptional regulator [Clostridium sp. SHJSY1]
MKNILYTRLIRPKNKNSISRNEKLQDKINEISENKLTIISGGAAVGKSTLISEYVQKKQYMWLSLDENSDDLSYFWTYVLYGLKENVEDFKFYIDMLNPLVKKEEIFELIASLINELLRNEELFIVLDDFHYLEDKFLLETVEYFIVNSSENIHFIIISRRDIPIYLGNILMKCGVMEIKAEDLYLTLQETEEFIKNSGNVSDELIEDIYLNSEGWIGAIKLFLTVTNSNKNIRNIPKNNKLFIDYMHNEIINSLSEEEIDFLVKTSPLSYVNPEVYKEIGNNDGFEIIEKLIEKNMMIITIDEEKKVFRYHNILRQYLLQLFNRNEEKIKNQTIDSITSYLIRDENYDEAISIFVNWNRYDEALEIIERNAQNIIATKILNDFPLEYYSKSIDLALVTMFFNYLNLDYEKCITIINSINGDINEEVLKCMKVFKIIMDNASIENIYFQLPKKIDENLNVLTRTIYYVLASWILGFWGELTKALEMIELTKENNKNLKNSYIDIICRYNKISMLEEVGKLKESELGYKELNEVINSKNYKTCFSIFYNVGLPGVYIKELRVKEAEALLVEAQDMANDLSGKAVFSSLVQSIEYNLAEVKYIQGDIDECENLLDHFDKDDKGSYAYLQMSALRIRLLSSEDRVEKEEYEDFISVCEEVYKNSIYTGIIRIPYGIALFKLGKLDESLEVFNKVVFVSRKNGAGYNLIYSLLWKAIVLEELNVQDLRECVNSIKEAIFYSRDEEILFPYYMNRKYLKEIIKKFESQLLVDKDNKEFIKKLYEIMSDEDNSILSPREMEVLNALVGGLTNKEIGERLYISVSTVKTHIINIYSKLGVKNRVEAVNEGMKILKL